MKNQGWSLHLIHLKKSAAFFILFAALLASPSLAQDCEVDELLPKKPWYTGISSRMDSSMALTTADGVHTDFHGIWMHNGWKNNFGPCTQNYPWTRPEYFQEVIDAGKIPVVFYWWHFDNPQSISLRREAEQQLRDCLVPFLNEVNRPDSEVWVVLQPEYNMHKVHLDPTFPDHLNTMIDDLRSGVTGVQIKLGPCPGNFGNMEDRYRLHPSLEGVLDKCDFIAFHDIQRHNPSSDAIWDFAVPGQTKTCLSFCRFLNKTYDMPIFFAYWSVANQQFGQNQQAEALKDIFRHQAEFERYGVFGFGPFWYQSEYGFATEGIKSPSNSPFQVFNDYKSIVNNIAEGKDYIHSTSFLDFDYGSNIEFPLTLRWISAGKNGPITYSIYYQVEGGERVLIADNLAGSAAEIMKLEWDPCNFPTTPLMNFIVVADDGTESISPKVSYNNPASLSDAIFDFEDGDISAFSPITSGVSVTTTDYGASGSKSLQVNLAKEGVDWSYLSLEGPIPYTGANTMEMMIYVPYSLNNTMDLGSEVTLCEFYMQTTGTWQNFKSEQFGLNQGWNKVTWNFNPNGNNPKEINLMEIRLWNRMWVYDDVAKMYIDDIKFGDPIEFSVPTQNCTSVVTELSSCPRDGSIAVGLNSGENELETSAPIFPNPFDETLYLDGATFRAIEITNSFGHVIFTTEGNIDQINTSGLASGFYLIGIKENGTWKRYPLVKSE